ncbi:MAG: FG-GAP-like repeat-containing protein [Bacteroidota bacterium]
MKLSHLSTLVVLLLFCNSIYAQTWQFTHSPTRQNLARLDMISDSMGLAVSYDGLILKYNKTEWSIEDSLDRLIQWRASIKDTILQYPQKLGDIYTIHATNDSIAWLAVNDVAQRSYALIRLLLKSKKADVQFFPVKIRSIDFHKNGRGIAVGEGGGYLFKDGEWKPLKLPISVDYRSVKIVGEESIFICGDNGTILKGDGNQWKKIKTDINETLRNMDFISENEGWIVGDGIIMHYINDEIDYEIAESTNDLWAVDMITSELGYAVGEKGTILKYNGEIWELEEINSEVDLHDIEILGPNTGYIVGARGAILKFTQDLLDENKPHQFLFSDQVHLGSDYLMDRIDDVYGITIADFNNDDKPDVYITCYKSLNHLLINQGDGYYNDQVIESGTGGYIENRIGKEKYEYGSLSADFDRDGDSDLFLLGMRNTSRYFVNNGKAVFKDWTANSNIPDGLEIKDGAIGDFNEDGYPDIVVADEYNGIRIFMNQKYNQFSEESIISLNLPQTGIRAVKVADMNGDHHQDIFAVFPHEKSVLLLNDGKANWIKSEKEIITNKLSAFINSITFADFNKDGFNDLFLCSEDGNDAMYIYHENKSEFVDETTKWKIKKGGRSYSAVAGDFNLDGSLDLFVSRFGFDYLYLNSGKNSFREVGLDTIYAKSGFLSGFNTGSAACDIDNNGSLDLLVGNSDYWSSILQNQIESQSYLIVHPEGVEDTREALGAKIWLWKANSKHTQENIVGYREILPSNGLFSQNWHIPIFGLGDVDRVDVKIRFLNGDEKFYINIEKGSELRIYQSSSLSNGVYSLSRAFLQFINLPNMIWEIIKFILFIILILGSVRFIEYRYRWRPAHAVLYVVILISVYMIFLFSIDNIGIFYHMLPFILIIFAMLVLSAVNEPIRKASQIQKYNQEKVQEAGIQLSRVQVFNEATEIVKETLKVIYPYEIFALYIYHSNGNVFSLGDLENLQYEDIPAQFVVERKQINQLRIKNEILDIEDASFWDEDSAIILKGATLFPLVRKKELLGIVLVKFSNVEQEGKEQNLELVKYLFLQLSISLDNLRILKDLSDHEKISAIGTFSSGIIHNLKNPIDGLRMIIEILKEETPQTDSRSEYVDELYSGILSLKDKLVHSFDFIHYEEVKNETLSINDLIFSIIKNHSSSKYSIFNLKLIDKDLKISGDQEQLKFVFENIIQNAIEASELREPVTIEIYSHNEKFVNIDIIDSGEGISDENIGKIFDMFFSTKGKSRGLGLTIAQKIIKHHNGFINVSKEETKGTKFSVVLPII